MVEEADVRDVFKGDVAEEVAVHMEEEEAEVVVEKETTTRICIL